MQQTQNKIGMCFYFAGLLYWWFSKYAQRKIERNLSLAKNRNKKWSHPKFYFVFVFFTLVMKRDDFD